MRAKVPNVRQQRRTLCVPHREAREQCTYLRPRRGVFYCSDAARPFFTAALFLHSKVACSYCTTYRPKPVRTDTGTLKEVDYSAFFHWYFYWYTWRPRANDAARYPDVN